MMSRTLIVYGTLLAVWGAIVGWQVLEHDRVTTALRRAALNRPLSTAKTLAKVIQSLGLDTRSERLVEQERLETVLKGLVTDGEVSSVALLNAAGEPVLAAGEPIDFETLGKMQTGEHWDADRVTVVRRVDLGMSQRPQGETNRPPIVVPARRDGPGSPRERPRSGDPSSTNQPVNREMASAASVTNLNVNGEGSSNATVSAARDHDERGGPPGPGAGRSRRRPPPPFWLWMMSEEERKSMAEKRGLHGLVIAMSTESFRRASVQDLWLRWIIGCFGGMSVVGLGLAWRNVAKSSELQMRLLRASELNSHLKEMNVAAAGLAHETRNPLNIIRGLAQMISKRADASAEIQGKSREIADEVDRVTAQLNEFINYSKPREVRRAPVVVGQVMGDVVRALRSDIEDKAIQLDVVEENVTVEADEPLLRQVLFNLLMNAIQAVERGGEIQVVARKENSFEAFLEIRDNGPGVPSDQRAEIFKPYFTTHQTGTGLGLAVVQQIVLAHGWDIEYISNEPRGAIFRLSCLKLSLRT